MSEDLIEKIEEEKLIKAEKPKAIMTKPAYSISKPKEMNPEEKTKIEAPTKGQVVTKKEYNEIITGKMQEMRDNRGRGDGRSGR